MADIAAGLLRHRADGHGRQHRHRRLQPRRLAASGSRTARIAYPVSEVTIAGNLAQMFSSLVPAADLEIHGSTDAPTVRIDGLTVAGT